MPESANVAVVRRFYDSLGSPARVFATSSVACFRTSRIGVPWQTSCMTPANVSSRLARTPGRAKCAGKTFTARFSHCWTVDSATLVRLQQCADTAQITGALQK